MAWKVYLYGIWWDGGDMRELPPNLCVTIHQDDADTKEEAIEIALEEASEEFGHDIVETEQIDVKQTRS